MTSTSTGEWHDADGVTDVRTGTGTGADLADLVDPDTELDARHHPPRQPGGPTPPSRPRPSRRRRLPRGPSDGPPWERPALLALLGTTAVLYLWGLGASGWANAYYSAAAQAGSQSWKALFFASSDAGNSITVDKPPVSLWVMGLSARIFGVNSWSILVPEALMGVAAVALLYAAVRRTSGPAAGLIAGVVLATTPVATLMFRFNNPDALLVLLLVAAAYATLRAQEKASTRWLMAAGALVGFAFLTKMLQALLVVPAFGLVYLLTAPTTWWRRVRQLGAGLAALVASAGWYIALVELVPESARPYIGGSQHNSILELTLGYNGLGRLTGDEVGSVGGGGMTPADLPAGATVVTGGPGGGGGWGETGWLRLFNLDNGTQISWLLPAALLLLIGGFWAYGRVPRTDRGRAALGVWGGWLLVTGLVFSHMQGIFHAYYDVALAPAIAAVVAIGSVALWERAHQPRDRRPAGRYATVLAVVPSVMLAVAVAGTAVWSFVLLDRTPDWNPWLKYVVVVVGVAAGLLLLVADRMPRRAALAVAAVALVSVLAGPAAYSVVTAGTPHTGAIPSAGPGGGTGPGGAIRVTRGGAGPGNSPMTGGPGQIPGTAGGQFPGGQAPGGTTAPNGGTAPNGTGPQNGGGPSGGVGGLLDASDPSDELVALLRADADAYDWVAAAVGSNSAAGVQLGTGESVMAIGGFNGSDPSPTLERFQQYVADGRVHYFLGGGGMGEPGGGADGNVSSAISEWVEANFTSTTVDGTTLYDLTAPLSESTAESTSA